MVGGEHGGGGDWEIPGHPMAPALGLSQPHNPVPGARPFWGQSSPLSWLQFSQRQNRD